MTSSSEQPIFTCNAHVFHIDPKTKRTWITASTKAISVSFFYDSSRNLFRIISVEGTKAVINSTITPNMTFTQTSQKFGQWSDVRANTVYGLGFSSELELTKFVEKFQEVKEATKKAIKAGGPSTATPSTGATASGTAAADNYPLATVPPPTSSTPIASANTSPISGHSLLAPVDMGHDQPSANEPAANNSSILPPLNAQDPVSPSHKFKGNAATSSAPSSAGAAVPALSTDGTGPQMKYENERLKLALAQSSANARNW